MINFDGHYYEDVSQIPDIGSWVCTDYTDNRRDYEGLSIDVPKLPKYNDLGTGSTALCVDTGDFYKYEATTSMWYKL